jgi:hypothetical protein
MSLYNEMPDTRPDHVREESVAQEMNFLRYGVLKVLETTVAVYNTVTPKFSTRLPPKDENMIRDALLEAAPLYDYIKGCEERIREAGFEPPVVDYYVKEEKKNAS